MMAARSRRVVVGVLVALWGIPGLAQAPALVGRVTDVQGAVIVGAEVRAHREDGAAAQRTITDATGTYRFDALATGGFVIEVAAPGFQTQVRRLAFAGDRSASLDVQLDVAGVDEGVVVTASGLPQLTQATSKAITLIDAQEIHARNEVTLMEIVRYTPGVQVRDNGGPGQAGSMRIRGLRPDAAAVLVDGLRLRDAATAQGDVTSFVSNLNFVAADRVEVLRGSGSSLYGTNAVGGVVNVVSREGGSPTRGDAQIEGGSLGHLRARGAVSGGLLSDRVTYSLGGVQWNVRDGLDGHDSARSTGAQGMLRYQFTPTTSLTARTFGSNDRVEINSSPTASGVPATNVPNSIIVDAIPVAPEAIERVNRGFPLSVGGATYIPGRDDPDNIRSSWFHTTALQYKQAWSPTLSWQGSYQRVHTSRTYTSGPRGPGFQTATQTLGNYVGDVDTIDARVILQPASWLGITAGYEFEQEHYHERQDDQRPAPLRVQTDTSISQTAHAGFTAAQIALLDRRLQISLSGRVQGFKLGTVALSAIGVESVYDRVAVNPPPRAVTGDLSAAYMVAASGTKFRAHVGNAYRAPGLYERFGGGYSSDPVSGLIIFTAYGDPRLEPDRYLSFDAGIDQSAWRDRVKVSMTAFDVDVTSLTAFDSSGGIRPNTDPFGRSLGYVNGSGGFSRGLELGVDARPTSGLRLSTSYTFTNVETNRDITVPGFFTVPGVFGHMTTMVVTNSWTRRFDTTFDLFHGSSHYAAFFAAGRPRAYRFPGFTKAAVIAGYRLSSSLPGAPRAYVKVENLFNTTYYQSGWRAPGRTAMVGLSFGI